MKKRMLSLIFCLISLFLFTQALCSTGTGFFISNDGLIVTCAHVIESDAQIVVKIDNKEYTAQVLSTNEDVDLALLKINYRNPYHFSVKSFDTITLGDAVLVLGYPLTQILGVDVRLTDGIVSAKSGIGSDPTYFQMSAPIQPGNSGGPIFDKNFRVIGVAASKLSDRVVFENIGSLPQNVNFGVKSNHISSLKNNLNLGNGNIKTMEDAIKATVLISVTPKTQVSGSSITIANRTGFTIFYIFVSPVSDTKWGSDKLGSNVLLDGASWKISSLALGTTRYDIRLVDEDGDSYTKNNLSLRADQTIEFTFADYDVRTSNTNELPKITIENNTGYTIFYMYISPTSSNSWGNDFLDDDVLLNKKEITVTLPTTISESYRYDIRLIDSDDDTYTKRNVLITPNMRIVFRITDLDLD